MLDRLPSGAWEGRCDGCLVPCPRFDGDLDAYRARLREDGWEIRPGGTVWCVDCSRKAREVKRPFRRRRS